MRGTGLSQISLVAHISVFGLRAVLLFSARTHWGRPLEASQYEFIVRESVVEVHFHRIEIPTVSTLGNALRSFFSISSKLFSLHLVWFII